MQFCPWWHPWQSELPPFGGNLSASCHSLPGDWCQGTSHARSCKVKYGKIWWNTTVASQSWSVQPCYKQTTHHLMISHDLPRCHGHLRYLSTPKPGAPTQPISTHCSERLWESIPVEHPTYPPLRSLCRWCWPPANDGKKSRVDTRESYGPSGVLRNDLETSWKNSEKIQPEANVKPDLLCSLQMHGIAAQEVHLKWRLLMSHSKAQGCFSEEHIHLLVLLSIFQGLLLRPSPLGESERMKHVKRGRRGDTQCLNQHEPT